MNKRGLNLLADLNWAESCHDPLLASQAMGFAVEMKAGFENLEA
jgi:hypothetical protein